MARKSKLQKQRNTVAIVGDGQTERIYFSDVRDTDRPANLSIFPDFPRTIGNYKGVLDRAMILSENYDRVYALIDMDKIIQDNQLTEYSNDKAGAQAMGIRVLENNPCFEVWLLLHFLYTGRLFNNCNNVSALLRRNDRIPHYEKSVKFLRNARLYYKYKTQMQEQAIPNAKRLEQNRADQDRLFPRAQTYEFFDWYFQLSQAR